MDELFRLMRDDLVIKMYDNNIDLDDIAFYLDMSLDEFLRYLKLEKTDYLVYRNAFNAVEMVEK